MSSISGISFILLYLFGITASVFSDPIFGVLAYMFDYFMNPKTRWWFQGFPDLRYSFIAAISLILGYAIRSKSYSINRIFRIPQTKWLFCQTVLLIALSFIALDPLTHNEFLVIYLKVELLQS